MNPIEREDPELWKAITGEEERQQTGLEMIASENYASTAVLAAHRIIAADLRLEQASLDDAFVRLTGQAPMTYVTSWRMALASRLLREERHTVREIAGRVGYDSEFAFARAFKRTVGEAPGRYRAAAR